MAKGLVILFALFVLGAAAPLAQQQKPGTPLQQRKTKMDWEQLTNTIEEVFGITADGKTQDSDEQSGEEGEQLEADERKQEFLARQKEKSSALENREQSYREAAGRAEGHLPEREARRRQQINLKTQHLGEKNTQEQGEKKDRYFNNFPLYEFSYGVHDPATGDRKEQWEKRVGDYVKGKYTLDQPDGTRRVVEYEADDRNGFEAVVKEIDRIDERHDGDVRWGHSADLVAQSYSKFKKVD